MVRKLPRFDRLHDPAPHARVLSNGAYTVVLTGAGAGFSTWRGSLLTSWNADRTTDGLGFFLYLRDADAGWLWSAGHQPTGVTADSYEARSGPGTVTITRLDHEVETHLEVCVDSASDVEIRRIVLVNRSDRIRTVELTSYAEVVLNSLAAHQSHPAFSKLFVQTEWLPDAGVLLASRRPRSTTEQRLWAAHAMTGDGTLEHETDRVRFVGRGGSLAMPLSLQSNALLSGTAGNVLDPVFALRRTLRLDPGASARLDVILAAAADREAALAAIEVTRRDVGAVFHNAAERERGLRRRLGLRDAYAEALQELAGGILYGDPRIRGDHEASESARAYWQALGLEGTRNGFADGRTEGPRKATSRSRRYRPASETEAALPETQHEQLRFDNGYGGFAADGSEYVIRIPSRDGCRRPPMPWINVIANERCGFLVSESGAATTWSENSREHRLTPWSNDPVIDPHGEALYLRDEKERVFWSPLPGPVTDGGAYEVRHGFGFTRWRHTSRELEQEVLAFVPRHDPVKVTLVKLRNMGRRKRRLSIFSYQELVLGVLPSDTAAAITVEIDAGARALLARNPADGTGERTAFAAAVAPPEAEVHLSADRTAFLGRNGDAARPAAVAGSATLEGRSGSGLDPCAALQTVIEVPAGRAVACAFLLGDTPDSAQAGALIEHYRRPGAIEEALAEVRTFWRETLSAVRIETPAPAVDLMVNGWLLYQVLSCRLWGRSAFYQSGGAFGFRDQLQDSAALVYSRSDLTRAQILLHAAHQFVEGDVLHWWHPPADRGTRTRCSDDLLWLPYITSFYVRATGDSTVLDETAGFMTARQLEPGEDETYLQASASGESAGVYEHCCRAIDRSLTAGVHGLPLMGTCDWNDGMNRVGREGRGESVWLGFFLYAVLEAFLPICERRGDAERMRRYRERRDGLQSALEDAGWDGAWYRRAYYDDGTPLGSAANDECRIDALAQAWAVISRAARPERARQAMEAAERELVDEQAGLVRLLTPPFDRTPKDPGYIKGYLPGIRENGGQYTHGATWVVRAFAELGRRDRAARLLEMLTPVHHALDRAAADVYEVEPYVVAADVYGAEPHVGRGGWTWYTGSAAWMYRVALESVLGFTIEDGEILSLRPCIPDDWPQFSVHYRLPDGKTRYAIVVENPAGNAETMTSMTIDEASTSVDDGVARIPLAKDGLQHRVQVTLGAKC